MCIYVYCTHYIIYNVFFLLEHEHISYLVDNHVVSALMQI